MRFYSHHKPYSPERGGELWRRLTSYTETFHQHSWELSLGAGGHVRPRADVHLTHEEGSLGARTGAVTMRHLTQVTDPLPFPLTCHSPGQMPVSVALTVWFPYLQQASGLACGHTERCYGT